MPDNDEKYPFVILAGGSTPQAILDSGESETGRAFIDINGRPMLSWVLDAVRNSSVCSEIMCIGNKERMISAFGLKENEAIDDLGSMLENFMAGMNRFKSSPRVFVSTCDIPLLTTDALKFLVGEIRKIDADIYYPIINVEKFDEMFPGGKRTTQKLKEGTFTGGNVFMLDPVKVIANRDKIEAVIRDRKSPAKLIKLFGFVFIMKFALRQLDLKGLEKKASEILGARMRGVITPYPEVGFDVDKPEDLEIVRKVMKRESASVTAG